MKNLDLDFDQTVVYQIDNITLKQQTTLPRFYYDGFVGKIRCPADWTVEYIGYLVSEATVWSDHHRSTFECLDSSPESAPNSSTMQEAAFFHHVSAQCSGKGGLNYCPPYKEKRELSSVVCTK